MSPVYPRNNHSLQKVKGFTLTELIVVMALVVVSSTVVLFNYRGSRESVVLSASALDIANMIHLAQVGGRTAGQGITDFSTTGEMLAGNDRVRSGVQFDVSGGKISKLTVYRGVNLAAGYQSGSDVPVEVKNLAATNISARLCTTVDYVTPGVCSTYGTSTSIEFSRLASDPIVESAYRGVLAGKPAVIQLESASGNGTIYRYVVIEPSGNIFVR